MRNRKYSRPGRARMAASLVTALSLAAAISACAHRTDLSRPATQDNVGVEMAKMSLWREAMFRFQRAIELNPADARAHNNLAVAFEANGEFEAAAKEYREALKLDRSNSYIQKNYSRFTEFMARSKKKPSAKAASSAAHKEPVAATTAPSATTTPSVPPPSGAAAPPVPQPPPPLPDAASPAPPPPAPNPPGGHR